MYVQVASCVVDHLSLSQVLSPSEVAAKSNYTQRTRGVTVCVWSGGCCVLVEGWSLAYRRVLTLCNSSALDTKQCCTYHLRYHQCTPCRRSDGSRAGCHIKIKVKIIDQHRSPRLSLRRRLIVHGLFGHYRAPSSTPLVRVRAPSSRSTGSLAGSSTCPGTHPDHSRNTLEHLERVLPRCTISPMLSMVCKARPRRRRRPSLCRRYFSWSGMELGAVLVVMQCIPCRSGNVCSLYP